MRHGQSIQVCAGPLLLSGVLIGEDVVSDSRYQISRFGRRIRRTIRISEIVIGMFSRKAATGRTSQGSVVFQATAMRAQHY